MTALSRLKQSTALTVALTFASFSPVGHANRFGRAADEAVAASRVQATAFAQDLVRKDFAGTLDLILGQLKSYATSRDLVQVYERFNREIESAFKGLKVDDERRRLVTIDALRDFERRYEDAIRLRFLNSWVSTTQELEYQSARRMIAGAIGDAKERCRVGASLREGGFLTRNGLVTPPYVSRFAVNTQFRPLEFLTGGMPISLSYHFTSATAGSSAANRDRANAVGTATSASNLANTFVIKQGLVTAYNAVAPANWAVSSAGGTLSNAMVAAAPYLAAVALVTILVMDVTARAEASRLNKQIQNALDHQYRASADHEFVANVYRETCASMVNGLSAITEVMDQLEGPGRDAVLAEVHQLAPEINVWSQASVEEDARSCKVDLNAYFASGGCAVQEAGDRPGPFESGCLVDRALGKVVARDQSCSLPYDDGARERELKEVAVARAEYQRRYTPERVLHLLKAVVALAFEDQESVRRQLWDANLQRMDDLQRQTFRELLTYLGIVRQAQLATSLPVSLSLATAVRREIDDVRVIFVRLTERAVHVIFGRDSSSKLRADLTKLGERTRALEIRNPGVREISDLSGAIRFTLDELKGGIR